MMPMRGPGVISDLRKSRLLHEAQPVLNCGHGGDDPGPGTATVAHVKAHSREWRNRHNQRAFQVTVPQKPMRKAKTELNPVKSACMIRTLMLVFIVGLFVGVTAEPGRARLRLDIVNPNLTVPVAVPEFVSQQPGAVNGGELAGILRNDLALTGLFSMVQPETPLPPTPQGEPDFEAWGQIGAQAIVIGSFTVSGDKLTVEARLYDVALRKLEIGKRLTGDVRDRRRIIHRFADRIMEALTGVPGCFSSRIAFIHPSGRSKEIYSMDFDGHDVRKVTNNGSINLSPEWVARQSKPVVHFVCQWKTGCVAAGPADHARQAGIDERRDERFAQVFAGRRHDSVIDEF